MQIGVEAARAVDNKRVFVVDTDEISRMAAVFMLHDENETHELPSLKADFDKAAEWRPDLLVLGEALVNEEGKDVFARCAQAIPGVKTLLLAGEGKEEFAQACRQSGADGALGRRHVDCGGLRFGLGRRVGGAYAKTQRERGGGQQ